MLTTIIKIISKIIKLIGPKILKKIAWIKLGRNGKPIRLRLL